MKKIILIGLLLLLSIFLVSSIDIPVEDETITVNVSQEVKLVLKDYYRRPLIEPANCIERNNYESFYCYLSFEKYNGTEWLPTQKKIILWKDYKVESRYCKTYNQEFNICTEWDNYSKKDFAKMRIAHAVEKWALKEYERITQDSNIVDIGEKTINMGG